MEACGSDAARGTRTPGSPVGILKSPRRLDALASPGTPATPHTPHMRYDEDTKCQLSRSYDLLSRLQHASNVDVVEISAATKARIFHYIFSLMTY